ncbi:glycosyltransferase family 4 protein [Salinarimonas soli]|uniref:Glycosyltransferase family 1 protein n=1 Tax=Salinarimonas soli TaxID=1638099 RepID=A0A5B2VCI9_9HYPH|nr:glycosyltransferase family 1 protein [Salinarimonas soli]KAA2236170.1 glycosyltransferase family 1 protein [Salinarimonas soli]
MRLLIATDAWHPQINGVVRSLEAMAAHAPAQGAAVSFVTPRGFNTLPMPGYPEIRMALATPGQVSRRIDALAPDWVHIATEGPIGLAARAACLAAGRPFTTSYHTRFPEYLAARAPVPESWSYAALRRFHRAGRACMVGTPSLARELEARGFTGLVPWTRGVDTALFRPRSHACLRGQRPVFLCVGRLAVEKNVAAFLALDLPGTKVVVGDGPARADLERIDPRARFLGALTGEALARAYAAADVFVFPSLTDTFGLVLLEALASGLPVAAHPVTGPLDVVGDTGCGVLDRDLREACLAALDVDRARCRERALLFSWEESARQFFGNIRAAAAPQARRGSRDSPLASSSAR